MKVFFRLLSYLRPYRLTFVTALVLVAVVSGLELLKPWPLKLAVDQIIGRQPLIIMDRQIPFAAVTTTLQIVLVIGMLLMVHVAIGLIQLLNNYLTIRIGQNMVQDFRCELFDHLQRQSLLFHQQRPTGDLIYRLMGDTYAVQTLLMNGIFTSLTSSALLVGMFIILLRLDVELTLYAVGIAPLLFAVISKVSKRIGHLSTESCSMESRVYATVEQIFSSISLVQAFAREEKERSRFVAESQTSFDRKLSLYSLQTVYGWLVSSLTAAGTAVVMYLGVRHVLDGKLSTGELLVFISYLASLYSPVNSLSDTVANVRASLARARRVLDILDTDQSVREQPHARALQVKHGEVCYRGVSFGYHPDTPVLEDISFVCPGGSMVALVGQTGAGKTTLMSLLLRFFDPAQGSILIDGQDLRTLSLKSLREQVAVVLQDTQLFPLSVRDNIAYGRKNATPDDVMAAAKLANAHDFIMALPEGYDTVLAEKGGNLSGGQRQRLSIARALLKDAPLLILDEPTSALDAETESLIMQGLERLIRHRTTFVIAHRLSMMKRADMILVLKDRRVVESGSYDALLEKGGEFSRLHALQYSSRPAGRAGLHVITGQRS
jgi:ATP-binding cassette subfamily B protein/subfamily B ATP-binding cassette protein MsbA